MDQGLGVWDGLKGLNVLNVLNVWGGGGGFGIDGRGRRGRRQWEGRRGVGRILGGEKGQDSRLSVKGRKKKGIAKKRLKVIGRWKRKPRLLGATNGGSPTGFLPGGGRGGGGADPWTSPKS